MSKKSMERLAYCASATQIEFGSMLTLTYPAIFPRSGTAVKSDLHKFLAWYRRQKWPNEFLWFLEFQSRGAPHFHLLTEPDCLTPSMRAKVAVQWVGITTQTEEFRNWQLSVDYHVAYAEICKAVTFAAHTKSWELIREPDGARKYTVKYASKQSQKSVPNDYVDVGRYWGNSEGVAEGIYDGYKIAANDTSIRQLLDELGRGDLAIFWEHIPQKVFLEA